MTALSFICFSRKHLWKILKPSVILFACFLTAIIVCICHCFRWMSWPLRVRASQLIHSTLSSFFTWCVGLAEKIFARSKLSNTPKPIRFVKGSLRIVLPEVDSRLIENLINHLSLDGNAYRKSICKTLGKYFASNCQGLLKMLSNRLHSTRLHSTCLS